MNETEMKTLILALIKEIAPDTEPEKLRPNDNIRVTLEIDSFDYLRFIVGLDEKFGLDTPEQDYAKMETLQSMLQYLKEKTLTH